MPSKRLSQATIFPMPVNYAASWNESALELSARIIAREARAQGADTGFSPVVNLFTDARYGPSSSFAFSLFRTRNTTYTSS